MNGKAMSQNTVLESVNHARSTTSAESKPEHDYSTIRAIDQDIPNGDPANHDSSFTGMSDPLQHVTSVGRQGPVLGDGSMQSRTRPPPLSRAEFGDCAKSDGTRKSLDTVTPHSLPPALQPELCRSDLVPERPDVTSDDNPRNGMSNGLKKLRHTLRSSNKFFKVTWFRF
jgi:hypothetical protein